MVWYGMGEQAEPGQLWAPWCPFYNIARVVVAWNRCEQCVMPQALRPPPSAQLNFTPLMGGSAHGLLCRPESKNVRAACGSSGCREFNIRGKPAWCQRRASRHPHLTPSKRRATPHSFVRGGRSSVSVFLAYEYRLHAGCRRSRLPPPSLGQKESSIEYSVQKVIPLGDRPYTSIPP
jgi:hypothetical protein